MQLPHCENGQNCAIPFLGWLRVREKITCALSLHVPWSQVYVNFWLQLYIPGGPIKTVQLIKSIFSGLCSNHHISFLILLDRATFSHYNDTKIIKFGWELLIWWVILMDSHSRNMPYFYRVPAAQLQIIGTFREWQSR